MMRDDEFYQLMDLLHQGREPVRFFEGGDAASAASNDAAAGGPGDSGDAGGPSAADIAAADAISSLGLTTMDAVPGQTVEGAIGQALIDLALQQDTTSAQGMQTAISTLQSLQNLGFGNVTGLNPNNPTQSVDEMLAAQQLGKVIENVIVPLIVGSVPGAGTALSVGKTAAGLLSGQISPGMAAVSTAIDVVSGKLGIPTSVVTNVINGNIGAAVSQQMASAVKGEFAQALNMTPTQLNSVMNLTGLNKDAAQATQALGSSINQGMGLTPSNNIAMLGQALDQQFGFSASPGGAVAPGAPSVDTSGGFGETPSPAGTAPGAAPATQEEEGVSSLSMLGALGALGLSSGDEDEEDKYRRRLGAQVRTVSPFGSMPYA
jgi:hypothetical protein